MKNGRKPDSWYRQSGVVAVRVRDGAPQVLLVTSFGGKRWVIPKGIVEEGYSPARSAVKEAWEEAGVAGQVSRRMLGRYDYAKWNGICTVLVYRLDVDEIHRRWPEEQMRRRKWFRPAAAAARVGDPVLARIILDAFPARVVNKSLTGRAVKRSAVMGRMPEMHNVQRHARGARA